MRLRPRETICSAWRRWSGPSAGSCRWYGEAISGQGAQWARSVGSRQATAGNVRPRGMLRMKAYVKAGMTAALVCGVGACGGEAGSETAEAAATTAAAMLDAADVAQASRATLREGVPVSGPLEPKVNITVGAPIAAQGAGGGAGGDAGHHRGGGVEPGRSAVWRGGDRATGPRQRAAGGRVGAGAAGADRG